ncbi:MAG: hypothetical protein CL868_12830 [Cytophagaceae bacterium]|nr:hypothetical protein [Cytophagaceae bacterium]|tara:strand:- start:14020 stop:14259 length:240 start_codon:yes stop_codon:yes gene_type:complete
MAAVDNMRNSLISKILTIKDKSILTAIEDLVNSSSKNQKVELTEEQILMLEMSEKDIKEGNVISQEELFKREREWLNAK